MYDQTMQLIVEPPTSGITATANQIETNPAVAYILRLGTKRSQQTMASLLNIVARALGFADLKLCPWPMLRRQHVLALIQQLRTNGRAPSTINTYLAALKGVAMEAWTLQLIDTDTYQHIKHVRNVRGQRLPKGRALTKMEIQLLFQVCDQDRRAVGVRDAAILGLMLGCGLRRSEVVHIKCADMDHQDQSIRVMGKGNKERLAYVPATAWQRLQRWLDEVRGDHAGHLFVRIRQNDDVTDNALTDQAIYYILQTRQQGANIDEFSPHDLRRTFASAMLSQGHDLVTVKDAMGHSNIQTTQRYDRRGDERLKQARDQLDLVR